MGNRQNAMLLDTAMFYFSNSNQPKFNDYAHHGRGRGRGRGHDHHDRDAFHGLY